MNNNEFNYKYSAPTEAERREISDIRKQYAPQNEEESKLQRLRRLDNAVRGTAAAWALALGIVGCLIFGLGLSMILEWNIVAWGVVLCVLGAVPTSLAYPVYNAVFNAKKQKYGKEILRLTDELLNETDGE